jgi:hypothetical protein
VPLAHGENSFELSAQKRTKKLGRETIKHVLILDIASDTRSKQLARQLAGVRKLDVLDLQRLERCTARESTAQRASSPSDGHPTFADVSTGIRPKLHGPIRSAQFPIFNCPRRSGAAQSNL